MEGELCAGKTFRTFAEFEAVLEERKGRLNERLVKGNGNLTVARANAKIKDVKRHYRDDFQYAWVHYRCVHEGKFSSRGKIRECTSNKIECPVRLKVVAKRDRDVLEIVTCELNHNHDHPSASSFHYASDRRMTSEEEKTVAELSSLGVSCGKLLGHMKATSGKALKRHDITNSLHRWKENKRSGRTVEEETWKVLTDMAKNDAEAQFAVQGDQQGDVSMIFFQTSSMRMFMNSFPDVVCVDGTYCINNLGYPLYVLMVIDGDNCGHTVAYAIVRNENEHSLRDVVLKFVTLNPAVQNTRTFIVDKDKAEIAALKSVMPDCNILLCRFHVAKTFKDAIPKYCKLLNEKEKEEAKANLFRMLYAHTEASFASAYNALPSDLKSYVDKCWIPSKHTWAQHLTQHLVTWGNFTNNFLERHNRKIKDVSDHHKSLPDLISALLRMHQTEDTTYSQKLKDLELRSKVLRVASGPSFLVQALEEITPKLSPAACGMLKNQIEKVPDESLFSINVETECVTVKKSGNDESLAHVYDVVDDKCTCLFFVQTRLPCWHLMFFRHLSNKPLFWDIPNHWLKETLTQMHPRLGPGSNSVSIVERPKSKKLSEIEKRSVATDIWREVLEGMVACSQRDFKERCDILRSLGQVWREGKSILAFDIGTPQTTEQNAEEAIGLIEERDVFIGLRDDSYLSYTDERGGTTEFVATEGVSTVFTDNEVGGRGDNIDKDRAIEVVDIEAERGSENMEMTRNRGNREEPSECVEIEMGGDVDTCNMEQVRDRRNTEERGMLVENELTDLVANGRENSVNTGNTEDMEIEVVGETYKSMEMVVDEEKNNERDNTTVLAAMGELNEVVVHESPQTDQSNLLHFVGNNDQDSHEYEKERSLNSVKERLRKKLLGSLCNKQRPGSGFTSQDVRGNLEDDTGVEVIPTDVSEVCNDGSNTFIGSQTETITHSQDNALSMLNEMGLKFARQVKKRGRPKGAGKTCSGKTKAKTKKEKKSASNSLSQPTIDASICYVCNRQEIELEGSLQGIEGFDEWIKCDNCVRWFHQICAFGSSKATKALKYNCRFCKE